MKHIGEGYEDVSNLMKNQQSRSKSLEMAAIPLIAALRCGPDGLASLGARERASTTLRE